MNLEILGVSSTFSLALILVNRSKFQKNNVTTAQLSNVRGDPIMKYKSLYFKIRLFTKQLR